MTAQDLASARVELNGTTLVAEPDGTPPPMRAASVDTPSDVAGVSLPPTSYAFVVLPDAGAAACGGGSPAPRIVTAAAGGRP